MMLSLVIDIIESSFDDVHVVCQYFVVLHCF